MSSLCPPECPQGLSEIHPEGDLGSSHVHREVGGGLPQLEESHRAVAHLKVLVSAPAAVVTDELEVPVLRQIDEGARPDDRNLAAQILAYRSAQAFDVDWKVDDGRFEVRLDDWNLLGCFFTELSVSSPMPECSSH
jgi:hypothetical protein